MSNAKGSNLQRILSWALLGGLLLLLLAGVVVTDRRDWPVLVGDEAAYLMAADSLIHDLDLEYGPRDYQRFVETWNRKPEGLILQSGSGGRKLVYGKPFFYSAYVAPFLWLAPVKGAFLANWLLLALAAVLTAHTLSRRLGDAAPLWTAVFVFASVTWAYVFWAHADLFLLCLTAIAYSLAYAGGPVRREQLQDMYQAPEIEEPGRFALRWIAVGGLLATVALFRPFYAPLLLPAALAVPARRRGAGIAALAGGLVLASGLLLLVNTQVYDGWTSYGGERLGFYSSTGFPDVDFPREAWSEQVARRGSGSWTDPAKRTPYRFEPRLTAYNLLYLTVGRDVGILPYFLPVVLGLAAFSNLRGRWSLLLAAALGVACFLYVRPFNFYGGGAALGNRYFLPLYPAFWFLAARWRSLALPFLVTAASGLFLYPLWMAPTAFPRTEDGADRHVGEIARQYLPYETTQDHLKPSGRDDFAQNGLWIKPLGPEVRAAEGGVWITARRGARAELLVGTPFPLDGLEVELEPPGLSRLDVDGGTVLETLFAPSGRTVFDVELRSPVARHRMWWDRERIYNLYRLSFDVPPETASATGPVRFRLRPFDPGQILP